MPDEEIEAKPKRKMAAAVAELMHLSHASMSGEHSHPHSAYGSQGSDSQHTHQHTHAGDSSHRHHAVVTTASGEPLPFGMGSFAAAGHDDTAAPEDLVLVNGSLTAAYMLRLGSPLGVEGSDESGWRVLQATPGADGTLTAAAWDQSFETYQEALGQLAQQMATGDRPVLSQTWRSDMAFENVSTGDGRKILPGGCQYRDTPLPLMLQTVTEPGHMGAVLAGTIQQAGTVGMTAVGTGDFDANDAGRQFVSIIEARGRFGVSIDVAEAEGEFLCTEEDEEGFCVDGEMQFSMVRIMGLTGTPFPAFEDAYIEVAANAKPAVAASSADIAEPCEDCPPVVASEPLQTVTVAASRSTFTLIAAGGPAKPPRAWFEDPQFAVGDGRMVRQPDGQYLCPLTVTADGRVFGHFAGWRTCHTAYQACVTPPHSRTGYAAYNLRPLETADGGFVHVGAIAMGCGHIDDDGSLSVETVKAFYDGGPGAICAALVHAGEDRFGGWFAGTLAEGLTDRQVRKFQRLSVSGHWKEVWRGKGLDLVACAAGIFSPGFPVTAMAAAGFAPEIEDGYLLPDTSVAFRDGRPVALVAAGVVRQPMPWERGMALLQEQVDGLRSVNAAMWSILQPLLPLSAERLEASIGALHEMASANGNGAH